MSECRQGCGLGRVVQGDASVLFECVGTILARPLKNLEQLCNIKEYKIFWYGIKVPLCNLLEVKVKTIGYKNGSLAILKIISSYFSELRIIFSS
jgi:hypothetical protein